MSWPTLTISQANTKPEDTVSHLPLCEGIPGGASGKEPACQCRRHEGWGFDPSVRTIPWRRARQPTPIVMPGEAPWTEEPGGLQSIVSQRTGHGWSHLAHTHALCKEIVSLITHCVMRGQITVSTTRVPAARWQPPDRESDVGSWKSGWWV